MVVLTPHPDVLRDFQGPLPVHSLGLQQGLLLGTRRSQNGAFLDTALPHPYFDELRRDDF